MLNGWKGWVFVEVKKVGIVGSGIMGRGIAEVGAVHGFEIILIDIDQALLKQARDTIEKSLLKQVQRERLNSEEFQRAIQNIHLSTDLTNLSEAQLIIEAVMENTETKCRLLTEIESICKPETILASNTSSISISRLAQSLHHPERFIGMHFFNPVPKMKLVEVICGDETSESVADAVCQIAKRMDKAPVRVKNCPGFIVNRLLIPMINDAAEILSDGIASTQDIDTAMKFGANFPVGPLELADLIGVDTCFAIMETLHEDLDDSRYRPHPLLAQMVREGLLGKKSGKGFYKYEKA